MSDKPTSRHMGPVESHAYNDIILCEIEGVPIQTKRKISNEIVLISTLASRFELRMDYKGGKCRVKMHKLEMRKNFS